MVDNSIKELKNSIKLKHHHCEDNQDVLLNSSKISWSMSVLELSSDSTKGANSMLDVQDDVKGLSVSLYEKWE